MMDFCWNSELNRWKNIPIIVTLAFITGACWRVSITRRNSTSLLIFLLIGVLLSACQDFTLNVLETTRTSLPVTQNVVAEPATQTPAQVTSTSPSDKSITIKGVKIQDHSYIRVHGQSILPEGSCILSQLQDDGEAVPWWPNETCSLVEDGRWEIQVLLGEAAGAEELDASAPYVIRAWSRDDPSVEAQHFPFDLQGPPSPSSFGYYGHLEWGRYFDWWQD